MAQQTAVEWLVKTITEKHDKSFIDFYRAEIEESKQMEKEQIVAARMNEMTDDELSYVNAETYYNETYG